jgi:hypothetical protein
METDDVAGDALAETDDQDIPLEEEPAEPLEPAPEVITELAAACVRFVRSRTGVELDFSQDTLSLLDYYVAEARTEAGGKAQIVELVQSVAGAYLGEVLRLVFGGYWFAEGEQEGWRVDLSRVYLTFNPLGMVREALTLVAQDGWHASLETDPAERAALAERLALLPPVPDDEYFAPTTRFDVVSIAFHALRARMEEQGLGDVRFGPDDYRN